MLKKRRSFGRDQDLASIESMVNFIRRPNRIQKLRQLISHDNKALDIVRTMYFQDTFLFTYDVWELANVSNDFLEPGYDIDDLKTELTVVVEFQILTRNFKTSKKFNIV